MAMTTTRTATTTKGAAAHAVLTVLHEWGVDLVLTCPGTTEAPFLDASTAHPGVRVLVTTHEQVAISAADGYARATGRPAATFLHTNVGLANAASHLHCARLAQSPVVILNGMKPTTILNRNGFTTATHQRDYIRQHVLFDRVALRSDEIPHDLVRALKAACAEPGGPVYLGLPEDLMAAEMPIALPDISRHTIETRRRPHPEAVAEAARRLVAGRKLIAVAGSELALRGGGAEFLELAERLGATVLLEERRTMELGGVPACGARFAGYYGARHPAVREADVIFFAGTKTVMEYAPPKEPVVPLNAFVVHLSSDSNEVGRVDPADVGLVGNARLALADLLAALPAQPAGREERQSFCDRATAAYRESLERARAEAKAHVDDVPISVPALMQHLHELLDDDAITVSEPTTSGTDFMNLVIAGSNRVAHKSSGGSLGWAVGAAVGVQLARPDRRIVCCVGDGVFQFEIQALWSAVSLKLPITFVVVDNKHYNAVTGALKRYRGAAQSDLYPGTEIGGPDYATIARGFGAQGIAVTHLRELAGALEKAKGHDGPTVIVVETDPTYTGPADRD